MKHKKKRGKFTTLNYVFTCGNLRLLSAHRRSNPIATLLLMDSTTGSASPRAQGYVERRKRGRKDEEDEEHPRAIFMTNPERFLLTEGRGKKVHSKGEQNFHPPATLLSSFQEVSRVVLLTAMFFFFEMALDPPAAMMMRQIDL